MTLSIGTTIDFLNLRENASFRECAAQGSRQGLAIPAGIDKAGAAGKNHGGFEL